MKGRAGIGDLELTENEWPKACNQRGRYWLYVVYDCRMSHPRLLRVQDPFGKSRKTVAFRLVTEAAAMKTNSAD